MHISGHYPALCSHLNLMDSSQNLSLSWKSLSVFYWPTQQAVLKGTYYVCDISICFIWCILAGINCRFEVYTAVTEDCCVCKYRFDIPENSILQKTWIRQCGHLFLCRISTRI